MNTPLLGGDELVTSPSAQYDALRFVSEESPCPYLPGRLARSEVYRVDELLPHDYERLIGLGFRRCGRIVYRPQCRACRECRQLRVRVADFEPTRSMNRVWRLNRDITVCSQAPSPSNESYELFVRYLNNQHDGTMGRSRESFVDFLYDSPTDSVEIHYRLADRLIGVSIADHVPSGLSNVYMFFDTQSQPGHLFHFVGDRSCPPRRRIALLSGLLHRRFCNDGVQGQVPSP
jgi:arginine-tRNA-protein transferase